MKWISQQSSELSLGVRIPPGAHEEENLFASMRDEEDFTVLYLNLCIIWLFTPTVDNYVGNVHKGHAKR